MLKSAKEMKQLPFAFLFFFYCYYDVMRLRGCVPVFVQAGAQRASILGIESRGYWIAVLSVRRCFVAARDALAACCSLLDAHGCPHR